MKGPDKYMVEVPMDFFSYDNLTVLDMCFLLSNYEGYCDADKRIVVLTRRRN
jgi:hypothetical protein